MDASGVASMFPREVIKRLPGSKRQFIAIRGHQGKHTGIIGQDDSTPIGRRHSDVSLSTSPLVHTDVRRESVTVFLSCLVCRPKEHSIGLQDEIYDHVGQALFWIHI